nr:tyrosine-protein kinase ITK/TSK-like [Penaeus vannamei]
MAGKNEEVLVEAFMTKRSQNKRTFTHTNWKERWFVLSPKNLIYYDGDKQSGRRKERGRVELIRVVAVESVDTAVFQRDFVFQLCYLSEDDDQYVLYIAAPTAQDREQWLDYIRKLVADNDCLSDKYHQGAFIKSQWSCCKGGKNTIACTDVTWTINHNNNPPGSIAHNPVTYIQAFSQIAYLFYRPFKYSGWRSADTNALLASYSGDLTFESSVCACVWKLDGIVLESLGKREEIREID